MSHHVPHELPCNMEERLPTKRVARHRRVILTFHYRQKDAEEQASRRGVFRKFEVNVSMHMGFLANLLVVFRSSLELKSGSDCKLEKSTLYSCTGNKDETFRCV
ncbi:hypothetical protein NPIL_12961 [Nephila pilipes]|uniref:Uncharacterized protein n=1 Tax=Nephila pilipes TaxID=299642 RepID=A0A8X6TFU0_NEPPI|nr:hypothetical protein NPIL_12961 [Nephila pilipes]